MAIMRTLLKIYADEKRLKDYKLGQRHALQSAANFVNEHRASANGFKLGDLLLCKFNQTKKKPRKLERSKAVNNAERNSNG